MKSACAEQKGKGRVVGWMDGWMMSERVHGWVNRRRDREVDGGWTGAWTDEWMADGGMGGCKGKWIVRHIQKQKHKLGNWRECNQELFTKRWTSI